MPSASFLLHSLQRISSIASQFPLMKLVIGSNRSREGGGSLPGLQV